MYQNLTDTLSGGRYKGTLQLPEPIIRVEKGLAAHP